MLGLLLALRTTSGWESGNILENQAEMQLLASVRGNQCWRHQNILHCVDFEAELLPEFRELLIPRIEGFLETSS